MRRHREQVTEYINDLTYTILDASDDDDDDILSSPELINPYDLIQETSVASVASTASSSADFPQQSYNPEEDVNQVAPGLGGMVPDPLPTNDPDPSIRPYIPETDQNPDPDATRVLPQLSVPTPSSHESSEFPNQSSRQE